MRARPEPSLARQLLIWLTVALVLLVVLASGLAWWDARSDAIADAERRAVDIAQTVADAPSVITAIDSDDPTAALQPFTERLRRDTDTDFVVVMSTDGVRWTHPNPDLIGQTYQGSIREAAAGQIHTERYTGSLGPSVRAVVPVYRSGEVVALVSVGIRTSRVQAQVWRAVTRIGLIAVGFAAAGILGVALLSRTLRRQTHGLGASEITRMYEYYDAVLHSVREGLVLVNPEGRIDLHNDEARRLLGIGDLVGRDCAGLGLGEDITEALRNGTRLDDVVVPLADHVLVVNLAPAVLDDRRVGTTITIRDHTDLRSISTELDSVRGLTESLRSQAHESANRLHAIVSMVELGRSEEAVAFATDELRRTQRLTDAVVGSVDEPVISALLLGKSAQAAERGVRLDIDDASQVQSLPMTTHDAVTILGNLLDNAIDAAIGGQDPTVRVLIASGATYFDLCVEDSGPGIDTDDRDRIFTRGWSTKDSAAGNGRGLGLAIVNHTVNRLGGRIGVDRSPLGGARFEIEIGEQ